MPDDQDWRLEGNLEHTSEHHGVLERLLGSVHNEFSGAAADAQAAVGADVAITHDGQRLFGYATEQQALVTARQAIESACARHGLKASFSLSHWDPELDRWRRVDPPETEAEMQAVRAEEVDAERVETQTMVCNAGATLRASLEQAMGEWAEQMGLEYELVEHPHLLTTQIAVKVTGPHRGVEEFRAALKTDASSSIRADGFGTGII